jgi:Uma2 family endonuclease
MPVMIEILERPDVRRQVIPLSVTCYHTLRDLGLVAVRTELLNGVIVEKMTKSPLHTLIAHRLHDRLAQTLPSGYQLRKEDPLTLATSEPEPDIAIVRGDIERFRTAHPTTAELVAEIAVTSVGVDRAKADLYARAAIPVYWLVLPEAGLVEVYSEPGPEGYRLRQTHGRGETLTTWYGARVSLDDLFA